MLTGGASPVRRGVTRVTPATADALLIGDVRDWLRLDDTTSDGLLIPLIGAARGMIERRTNRALLASGWRLTLDGFPGCQAIVVPKAPVTAVTAVNYVDPAGVTQVLATSSYVVDRAQEPARIGCAAGGAWPETAARIAAVTVDFTAGYATAADIPDELKLAMRLLIAHWHENREAVIVGTIQGALQLAFDDLVEPFRMWSFG